MALNGKIAVVTGAAFGIGKAMTEILLKNGAKVALLDVNATAGKSLKETLDKQFGKERTLFVDCDVASEGQMKAAWQKTIQTFSGIDILCNNAGTVYENQWEKTISVNLMGVIRGTYLALEHMNKLTGGRGGIIVNTASIAGLSPNAAGPAYSASKHGVVAFTRAMAAASDASGYGVRFNAICPGAVQTELMNDSLIRMGPYAHLADIVQKIIDETGVLDPSQVAEAFLDLVTDETKNGEALVVTTHGKKYYTFSELKF